jgi:rod shape-determining protein MreB
LDKRLSNKINIPFHIAKNPLYCVANGTLEALKDLSYPFLMR